MSKLISVKNEMTIQWLTNNGFRYNRLYNNENTDVFAYRFPVHKYRENTILECELRVILGDKRISVDVYNYNTINRYAPFYHIKYGNYDKMLEKIWFEINTELKN